MSNAVLAPVAEALTSVPHRDDRLLDLVASAAHTSGSDGALLLLGEPGSFEVLLRFGTAGQQLDLSAELVGALLACDLYIERGGLSKISVAFRRSSPELRFLASTPVRRDGRVVGLLVVCDGDPRSLSGAQEYVFRTLAAEIGDQLDLQLLRAEKAVATQLHSTKEERLRLLESVVVNANDAVLITEAEPIDLPGPRIRYANDAFSRATGYSAEEVLGKTPRILQGPGTDQAARQKLRAALREWKSVEVEMLNYRKDGTAFWVELSIVPVADERGWYTHWVSVQRDISERKANEENAMRFRLAEAQNLALASEVQERKRVEAELAYTAFHDHLTGLRNRAYFMDRLKSSIEHRSTRPRYGCAVIFLDLDNFKVVNDGLGHSMGDLMLVEVAQRLKGCARPQDTIARMGGDEFTILLDDTHLVADAISVAERILEQLAEPIRLAGTEVIAGASIGLSIGEYEDPEHILRDADTAMYRAKQEGGARYAVFNEEMHQSAITALHTRLELRAAIEHSEFELHYQPLVDTTTERICGVEALVRWQHPERGLLLPADFIEIAEETGLIVPLGSWILHEACRHFHRWSEATPACAPLQLSVNVSSRQLDDPHFYNDLESALRESGLHPGVLQLEITESVFVENAQRIGLLFQQIQALGVRIAFDDFGTGYSSLSYLERYPIDMLKIDRSFVQRLVTGSANADIVRMIVALARALGMEVSAEGVEDTRQRDALLAYGCTVVQGFLYSRPVPFATMSEMLAGEGLPVALVEAAQR